jgi:two-component system cell cycle sensor histidine kinase/response regulator CckA
MSAWNPATFTGRHIVVADEDPKMVDFVITTLRDDGHAVFHAYDVLSATQLAIGLEYCDLVISNTKVAGADGVELIQYLRLHQPDLPIIYLANSGRSTPEVEAQLPQNIPILRQPFTAEHLRGAVATMLDGKGKNHGKGTNHGKGKNQ